MESSGGGGVGDACRRLGHLIANSINLILLGGCALLVLIETISLVRSVCGADAAEVVGAPIVWSDYALTIVLVLAGYLGCYGAYHNNSLIIRLFELVIGVCVVIVVFQLCVQSNSAALKKRNELVFDGLRDELPYYDWKYKDPSVKTNRANKRWDEMQMTLQCCGIFTAADWYEYQPISLHNVAYPGSCCSPSFPRHEHLDAGLCNEEEIFKVGCLERLKQLQRLNVTATILHILYLLLLILISLFCASRRIEPSLSRVD